MTKRFWLFLYRLSRSRVKSYTKGLTCCDCGSRIHSRDRYRILEVQHLDCSDTKKVGQMSIGDHPELHASKPLREHDWMHV